MLYQCPLCAGYFTRSVLTFLHFCDDVPEWSDGRSGQWWANMGAPVGRCPACSKVVWVEDATKLMPVPRPPRPIGLVARLWHQLTGDGRLGAERDWNVLSSEIKDAERIQGLDSAHDLLDALVMVSPNAADREIYVRRRLWWVSNDHRRLDKDGRPTTEQRAMPVETAHANMYRLLVLIENDPALQVERGDLLRQLGHFDEAVAVLIGTPLNGYNEVRASKIAILARRGDTKVRTLN
jgi:hypothetical protein